MLTLGYKASAEQFGPRELLNFAVLAEDLGFDSVVVSDHFHPWRHTGGHAPYSFAWLGAVGARTSRVRLGTSVVTPTFRQHPTLVAQAAATLALMFPGRFFLGVGSGEAMNEVPPLGIAWPSIAERQARLREAVELMQRLWTEEFVDFEGRFYRTKGANLYDRPSGGVPLYVAAGGPKAAELAGRLGDGLIATSGKGMDLYRDGLLPGLERGARAAGRDPARIERLIEVKVSFDSDPKRALADTRNWSALALPSEEKAGTFDPRVIERLAKAVEEEAHRRWIVSSDPEAQVAEIRPYVGLGFTHLVFHFPGEDQERALRLYAKEVLPRLRAIA